MSSVIVVGPQGCGKTRQRQALARMYGLSSVLDEWNGMTPVPDDCLVLTNTNRYAPSARRGAAIVEFSEAMKMLQRLQRVA